MSHWARKYIGKRWAADGIGPVRYSCWGLVREAARQRLGIELPPIDVDPDLAPSQTNFENLLRAARQTGMRPLLASHARADDIAVMRGIGRLHVGWVVADRGQVRILHSAHARGVVCERWADATRGMHVELWRRGEGSAAPMFAAGEVPHDREDLKSLVRVGVTLAANVYGGPFAAIGASLLLNELLPPSQPGQPDAPSFRSPTATGDSYSLSLAGNVGRIDQAIPKIIGRKEVTPPFACAPYAEFLARPDAEDPDLDRDQYVFGLYAVSIDDVDVIAAKIGNTPISRYADVLLARYLAPGEQPSTIDYNGLQLSVSANVVTATEVSGQVLETGRYVGGFAASSAKRNTSLLGIDVAATRGLGKGSDPLTVEWRVEYRPINDFGQTLGNWTLLATESRTAYTATPQRWTTTYDFNETDMPGPGRYEIRLARTDVQDTDPGALHEIAWIGMRSYLDEAASLNPDAGHYELIMRSSSQLSQAASRDLRLIVQGKSKTLDTDLELTDDTVAHRNPAWWLLDCATSTTWGLGKPLSRVDVQSIYDLAQVCDVRQDRVDYVFDTVGSGWEAMQLIARTCRARVFRRNGVISVARDELAEIPVTAFTPRNCQPGMSITERHPTRRDPDGYIVEYQDYRTNEWTEIECPMPGIESDTMERPLRLRMNGITGPTHAEREGLYEAASLRYRTRQVGLVTEMEGELPAFMDAVDYLPDIRGYGRSGDVEAWDVGTLTMTLTEPPDWSQPGPYFLSLIRDDGTIHDPLEVEQGDTVFDVVLPGEPDFEPETEGADRERTKYYIGRKELVKISVIADGGQTDDGAQLYRIGGVIDDERVHTADLALLPDSGEEQDVPLNPDDPDEDDTSVIVRYYSDTVLYAATDLVDLANMYARISFGNDGVLRNETGADPVPSQSVHVYSNQWVLAGAVDPSVADDFEVRFDHIGTVDPTGSGTVTGDTLATWLSLGTTREVGFELVDGETDFEPGQEAYITVRAQVRDASTLIVLEDRNFFLKLARL